MNEKQLQKAMELIAYAGDSRSQSVTAMTLAEEGKLSEARKKLEEAKKTIHKAHEIQTNWMSAEMNGERIEKSILLIHAQDHFMAADIILIMANKYINLYDKMRAS
ncbi:PTS lactose/cellobiose transporter subunit IIA [Pediococcus acidilactici]|uniref:PTS lactose/cellobiose transporter subunit IIA n=1 Tax=Pediococcus acidilactici TaxID=1254 RepID=UPI00140F5D10|nr:PTS lactose/cellobiose transporter subunit IIA [Pediococcus acidilactici]MCH9266989.1 PTS lactose/cellobiose transporter subunit IIA [Pediococcus acidilactici]MCK2074390.1 PTS lactose/cellobiose transporter subunit IIA [Pediococcus acidilactici]MDV2603787.1 PTS lactose/cellobiose transporter subunit IIA [Pediococcus acidilactici]MDV2845205.1 PTS lactose/cellobiose transporter subunit IIA [Pediococcus acidilactici]QIO84622.1 PTS lactose/cellobiose transporter subunit IIA [Pediococcus acidila